MPTRIATRASPLALFQADKVAAALTASAIASDANNQAQRPIEIVTVTTTGDQQRDLPIAQLAGEGVFVAEVQAAVLRGDADIAAHSAKDMRSIPTEGLTLVGCLPRDDVRDALVGSTLHDLPQGATVATGSQRRQAQLAHLRPDLNFTDLRGNIATRLAAVEREGIDAVVVAMAALERLELTQHCAELLSPEQMLPQAGQGAIAVECRTNDHETRAALLQIIDPATTLCVMAERAVLAEFGGGCDLPVGALAVLSDAPPDNETADNETDGADGGGTTGSATVRSSAVTMTLTALLALPDGTQVLTAQRSCQLGPIAVDFTPSAASTAAASAAANTNVASALGTELARHILDDLGGAALLDQS